MLAEIHHKIADDGRNLSDRLEDKLTGDVFGALRYLPFEKGLYHVLSLAHFGDEQQRWIKVLQKRTGYPFEFVFWEREKEGEIDLLLESNDVVIGIEVKYLSGLSSEDIEPVTKYQDSQQQLVRYVKMLERKYKNQQQFLLFLAPFQMMNTVKKQMQEKYAQLPVVLGFLCWEDIHTMLVSLKNTSLLHGEALVLDDIQQLLAKKRLKRFTGFRHHELTTNIQQLSYHFRATHNTLLLNWSQQVVQEDFYEFNKQY